MIAYGVRYSEYAEFRLAEAKRATEREHARTDEATRAQQERLELLAVISHELGNPLTIAKGNVAAIRRFLAEDNQLSHDVSNRVIDAEIACHRAIAFAAEELMAASQQQPRELELGPLRLNSAVTRAVKASSMPRIVSCSDNRMPCNRYSVTCSLMPSATHPLVEPSRW